MTWLLLLISVGCFAIATLSASATLISACLLLSLLCALAGGRGLYRRHGAGTASLGEALIDSHELKRLAANNAAA